MNAREDMSRVHYREDGALTGVVQGVERPHGRMEPSRANFIFARDDLARQPHTAGNRSSTSLTQFDWWLDRERLPNPDLPLVSMSEAKVSPGKMPPE